MAVLIAAMTEGPWAQTQAPSTVAPILIPGPGDGYQITKTDGSQPAPSGFEGRTDTSTMTAVGNTPATAGKRVVARFTISNLVRTCPDADGKAEGEGTFSVTVDRTDAQATETSTIHVEMRAKAKYTGQVDDDAKLEGPVTAEIDFSYTQSGTIRGASGALATPAGAQVQQHVTIPVVVGPLTAAPSVGAFAGGDPTAGHLSEAVSVGTALTYWAGVYYSVAQTKWRQGTCVQISFDPPSNTVQPALGAQATVKAEVKTKGGETVKGQFQNARAYSGGRVSPVAGGSDVGSPLTFTYTAPNQKSSNAGFGVNATSRAGVAEAEWKATLGTGWSGQISCAETHKGDEANNPGQSWSNFSATRLTIDVTDGVGMATGYHETKNIGINLRPVATGGFLPDTSSSIVGLMEGTSRARVEVDFRNGTYSIRFEIGQMSPGYKRSVSCYRGACQEQESTVGTPSCIPAGSLSGEVSNPNQLRGSMIDIQTGLGRSRKGTLTLEVKWDLARQGTSR